MHNLHNFLLHVQYMRTCIVFMVQMRENILVVITFTCIFHTVEPVLSGTVLSGHPLLSGQLIVKVPKIMSLNFDLY